MTEVHSRKARRHTRRVWAWVGYGLLAGATVGVILAVNVSRGESNPVLSTAVMLAAVIGGVGIGALGKWTYNRWDRRRQGRAESAKAE